MDREYAIPILPSRDLSQTTLFYGRLGFEVIFRQDQPDPYLIIRQGTLELHFFRDPSLDPTTSSFMCYCRVRRADDYYQSWSMLDLPRHGIPRIDAISDRVHGMREFAVVDPDGNLIRVGSTLHQ